MPDKRKMLALFKAYKEDDEDSIGPDGLEHLFGDLQINAEDIVTLAFSWKLGAKTLCVLTKDEFVSGLEQLRVDSLKDLKVAMEKLRPSLNDERSFKEFYLWCFDYYRDPSQRGLNLDMAKVLWKQVMDSRYSQLDLWLEFLDTKVHAISRDTYNLFLDFTRTCKNDFSNYDEAAAWPVLIDEYVEFARSKLNLEAPSLSEEGPYYSSYGR